jgi:PAS domain S-box-containing protein
MDTAAVSDRELTRFFPGDSELATRMRALDWSRTSLGAVETWPQSLCTSVSICLQSRFPILIWWGRELVMLYNDAYRPILGSSKHPFALGQRGQECWWEIWQVIGPMLESVLTQGEATWSDDALLLLDRNGYLEECYFTFSYSPILNETGSVGGIFTAVTETTKRVLSERRLITLSELAATTAGLTTVTEACETSAAVLAKNPNDVPFALLYSVDPATGQASLATAIGLTPGTELSPLEVNCTEAETDLSRCFKQVLETDQLQTFVLTDRIDWSSQSLALIPETAVVMPVARSAQSGLAHICVVGVSPRRALDREYQNFLELVAGKLARAIDNARAAEEGHKRTLALAEIDLAKTVFFSNISHEFRTPLTLMLGPLEELSNSLTDRLQPSEREQLRLIQRNAIRLQKLVNTLLDFARIEAGRIEASYEPTDLSTYTAELASLFRSLIEQAGMELEIDCPPLSVPIYVDRQMWEKIVFNLISNAFKFTFSGTISVRLQAVGDAVEFSVRDTGVGISTAELPQLFQRFHRVIGARSRTYEGSGIGLAFVKKLVELHQGSIDVTSVEGKGTCFTITIPTGTAHLPPERIGATRTIISTVLGANAFVEEAASWISSDPPRLADLSPELIVQSAIQPTTFGPPPARPAKILLADDNADLRDYLMRLLSPQYQVLAVADGIEALTAISRQIPDLILADVMMPNLDGLSLLQALRYNPQTREIPIILISARAGEEARIEGLAAGADDYITKPFSARELLMRVEVTLKLSQLRRAATQQEQTLRLEAETAKAQVETILTSIRDGFYVLDRDWCFTYVNDHFCQMMLMSRAEILGRNIWELFPPAIETEVYVHFHQAMRNGTPIQFENFYPAWQKWYEHRIYPSPSSLTIFVTEITERKLAEAKLHETLTLLKAIGDYSVDIIFAKDRAGRLLFVNPAISNYFGKSADELLGQDEFFFIQDRAAAEAIRANDRSIIQSGVAAVFEEPIIIDGKVRTFLSTKAPLRDVHGNILGIVGIGHDITERKLAEVALAERNQELDSFVHTVSHDLKAPLRAIANLSQWIEDDLESQLPPDNQQQFQLLRARVTRMESMIDSLLLYARAGRQEAHLETFDLAELLSEIIDSLAPPESFIIEIQPPLPTLTTKRVFLSQVLTNLISNAIQHHTSVTGHLHISAIEHPDCHEFIIRDDGPGIAPEHHKKVFDIFQTLKSKDNSDSTGVGLAIVKKIVEREKGTIRLESSLGRGTTFYLTWPKSHQ